MEKKDDDEYNDPEDQEPSEPLYRGRTTKRFVLTYEQQRVRNLNVGDIINRMNQLRLESQADKARPILGQNWRSASAPGSPPKRITFFPEFKRGQDMHLDNLEINDMPYGCVRSSSASPPKDRELFLQTLRVPVYEGFPVYGSSSSSLYNLSLDGSLTSRSEGWPPDPLLSNMRSDYPFPRYPMGLGSDKKAQAEVQPEDDVGEPVKNEKNEKYDQPKPGKSTDPY